jgi:predicted PurR-regulated permease PerM
VDFVNVATPEQRPLRLGEWARVFALAIAMLAVAWLLYQLLDVVLLVFLGVTLAAALQPWHTKLCQVGVPRGPAVLLIYLLFALALGGLGLLVIPVLIDEIGQLVATVPEKYAALLSSLRGSNAGLLRLIGQRLPPFEALPATMSSLSAESVRGIFGLTSGVFAVLTWAVTVFAIAFYWTLEVPQLERLVVSMLPAARRPQALGAWRAVESKLGSYLRAQGLAMLAVGVASGIGYLVIGLPNPLALAVLAGLFEGVPLLGPFLAAVPALLAALTLGTSTILLTMGWALLVQLFESNVLVPRIMSRAVGVSALVSIVAILVFGSVYGILGVFLAVPLTAALQVILDRFVLNAEPDQLGADPPALAGLRRRARALRQRVRLRLRERTVRMGIDPETPEHIVDAMDQNLEEVLDRIAAAIREAQRAGRATDATERTQMLSALQRAVQRLEGAVAHVDEISATASDADDALPLDELARATEQAETAVAGVEVVPGAAEEPPARRRDRG